ncbi:MAG TPA: Xaa-Pro peptidase family protein [Bacillota bacterium]|nr:Xaa-Pro peptidase family protein [Bacillota bacterium]
MDKRLPLLQAKLAEHNLDGILLTSPYNRRYISGFTGSAGYLLITQTQAILITDFRYTEQAAQQAPGFEIIRHNGPIVQEVLHKIKELSLRKIGFEKQFVTYSLFEELNDTDSQIEWVGVQGIIEELRMIKNIVEQELIKEACKIADKAFEHIITFIKPGVTEKEVALELEFAMRKLGADSVSFDTIVASGYRSALPHGVASNKMIQSGELVTLDFGAYYKGYVSDMTRTVAVGEPSDQLKEIYHIVQKAQLAGVSNIKAGIKGKDADALTRDIIIEAGYGEYFGHSTGHGIGLEVHEGPGLSSKSDVILRSGMVVTVEPGIYISQLGGVRIEDDVIITENGCEIITHSPKDLIIIS